MQISKIGMPAGSRHQVCHAMLDRLKVPRRVLATLVHHIVGDALALIECAHARTFDRADVHEHILAAIARSDEAKALLGIEKLHGTCSHNTSFSHVAERPGSIRPSLSI